MTGIMAAMLGIGSSGTGLSVTVGSGTSTFSSIGYYFWGWSAIGFTNNSSNSQWYPDYNLLTIGSVIPSGPTISNIDIWGVYSIGIISSTNANYYVVVVDGDQTANPSLITNLTIDGVAISGTKSYAYVPLSRIGTGTVFDTTYFAFQQSTPTTTLFGTTAGAVKSVVIS